jgi:hypothetical protein
VSLQDTDAASNVTITTPRRRYTTIGELDVYGSIGTIRAGTASLVGGTLSDSAISVANSIDTLTVGAVNDADILVGIDASVDRHAAAAADFVNTEGSIAAITITGLGGNGRFMVDSNFSAASIGAVTLKNVQISNGGVDFGLFALDSAGRVQSADYTDSATGGHWTYPPTSDEFPKRDFVISVM